jgi:hypothetical protein
MYRKPELQRYGSFADLTRTGFASGGDGCIVLDPVTGSVVDGNPSDGTWGNGLPRCDMRNGS